MMFNKVGRMMRFANCISGQSAGGSSSGEGHTGGYNVGTNISGGTSSSMGTSQQDVWTPQGQALEGMYNQASNLGANLAPQYANEATNASNMIGNVQGQGMDAWGKQLQGGVYGNQGMDDQFNTSLRGAMAGPTNAQRFASDTGQNNYQAHMKDAIMSDAQRAQQQMMQGVDSRAAASGMSGGSRHGTAMGAGMEGINRNAQNAMANTGYQAFESAAGRGMQAANNADANLLQQQQMMQGYLGGQQGAQANAVAQSGAMANLGMAGFDPLNAQWQNLQNQAGVVGGPTALSSSANVSDSMNLGLGTTEGLNLSENWQEGSNSSSGFGIL